MRKYSTRADSEAILREIFGVTEDHIEGMFQDLAEEGVVEIHEIDGKRYYSTVKFQPKEEKNEIHSKKIGRAHV